MLFRLFIKDVKDTLKLTQDNFHYLTRVLKLSSADCFEVVQGTQEIKVFKITGINKNNLEAVLESSYLENNESPIKFSLAQALLKPEKLELILQKCTEIGVYEFLFYCADKLPLKIKNLVNKLPRWEKIIESAVCQSRRNYKPEIKIFNSLKELLDKTKSTFYYADCCNMNNIATISSHNPAVIVGPESGFSVEEKKLLQNKAQPINLGKRILRTETAAIAVCSRVLL